MTFVPPGRKLFLSVASRGTAPAWILFGLIPLSGQTAASPAFEVASIKEATQLSIENIQAGQFHVGMNTNGSRADYGFMSLADLIPYAYRVKRYQISGPGWMNETRWDILATIPAGQPADRMVPDTWGSAIFQAVKNLGLELKSRKAPVETIIVDHVEKKPTAN